MGGRLLGSECCENVVREVWAALRGIPDSLVSPGKSARRLSAGLSLLMFFTLGTDVGALWPGVDSDVTPQRRLFLQSTRRP